MTSVQDRGVQIQLVSSCEKQPRQRWAKGRRHDDEPCRAVIEHSQQKIMLAVAFKIPAVQYRSVDAMALNRAMHEPDNGHRGDRKSLHLRNAAALGAAHIAENIAHDVNYIPS